MFNPTPLKRTLFFILFDIFLSLGTLFLAYNLRFNFHIDEKYLTNFFLVFSLLLLLKVMALFYVKIYKISWQFISLSDAKKLLYAHILAYVAFVGCYYVLPELFIPFPRSVLMIDFIFSFLILGTLRVSKRLFLERGHSYRTARTLLIGVSSFSQTLLKERDTFNIIAIIDNDKMVTNSYVAGMQVSSFESLEELIVREHIESVIIGKELEKKVLNNLYSRLNYLNIYNIKVLSVEKRNLELKAISVEDLLARQAKDLDRISIANFIAGKVVMITGAGGSIGSELSRQVMAFGAKQLILLDHSEFNLYQISDELEKENIVSSMISVKNKEALEEVFVKYEPEVVLHAAAYKHVPLCEENIESAVQNNIFGTKNVIDLCVEYEVEKFLLISTDKAVRPTNVMGTTKRVCELYAHSIPSQKTEIVAVRFGNVLGSSGSVIPKFKAQIEQGKNITVTHPEITRYFMLIPEACQLVLQAASIAKGGELFILDMGEPIKIVDLAQKMIELSGSKDIQIEFTGLRAGEKLYEELLINKTDLKTEYDSIMVAKSLPVDYAKLCKQIEALKKGNELKTLKEIVPEFEHKV
jgi:UDP-N-acetyl-D-glucosamine 4,6-dehydratase